MPKPVQRPHPPILLGGNGKGLLRIAARHASIVNLTADVGRAGTIDLAEVARFDEAAFVAKGEFVRAEAKAAGRDPQSITMSSIVSGTVTSSSNTSTGWGSLRPVRSVRLSARPAPVSTMLAPSCWARTAAPYANEASVRTPVITMFLPSRRPMRESVIAAARARQAYPLRHRARLCVRLT
jgi:hypothetical protein